MHESTARSLGPCHRRRPHVTTTVFIYAFAAIICLLSHPALISATADSLPVAPREHDQQMAVDSDSEQVGAAESDPKVIVASSSNVGFIHAFAASISVIIVSELGDKTFFIAAILAMRHPRSVVFAGAMSALALMTVLSVVMGLSTSIIPRVYTYYISTVLFFIFGLKMLREGYQMSPEDAKEEFTEAEQEVRRREEENSKRGVLLDVESGRGAGGVPGGAGGTVAGVWQVFLQSLTMTFVAEWGDRSQLTTIILAARENVLGVTLGGTVGHAICTGIAVLGGRFISQRISVRTVTIIGGVVFIIFALSAFVFNPDAPEYSAAATADTSVPTALAAAAVS